MYHHQQWWAFICKQQKNGVSEIHKFVSFLISQVLLSSSHLFWYAAMLYLLCRGINRLLLVSFVSPVTAHHCSDWLKDLHSLFVFFLLGFPLCKGLIKRENARLLYEVQHLSRGSVSAAEEQYPASVFASCRTKSLVDDT